MQHVLPMAARWLLLGSALLATSASPPLPLHLLGDLLAARAELHAGGNAALAATYGLVMEQAEKKAAAGEVWSVTTKNLTIPGVSKHNYISIGIYSESRLARSAAATVAPLQPPWLRAKPC